MSCSVEEQKLYFLCDGLLDDDERDALLAHCTECERCAVLYREAQKSLSLLQRPARNPPYLSQEKAMSIISGSIAREYARTTFRLTRFSKREFLFAAAAMVILSLVSVTFLIRKHQTAPANIPSAALSGQSGFISISAAASASDSTFRFSDGCTCHATAHTDLVMRCNTPKVVHFGLRHGSILIAAHKGLYDTIAVECGHATVLATGTHFSVSRTDSSVSVSVLEGSVKLIPIHEKDEPVLVLATDETCVARDSDAKAAWHKSRLSYVAQNQLSEAFAAMDCFDSVANPSSTIDDALDLRRNPAVSARSESYEAIRKMIRTGQYEKAITCILKLVKTPSADLDIAYCDLALCYSKTDQWRNVLDAYTKAAAVTSDNFVREAILHRTNHILFSKLSQYDDAEKGIRRYLALYPHGTWKEREIILLARVARAQKPHQ